MYHLAKSLYLQFTSKEGKLTNSIILLLQALDIVANICGTLRVLDSSPWP